LFAGSFTGDCATMKHNNKQIIYIIIWHLRAVMTTSSTKKQIPKKNAKEKQGDIYQS